VTEVRVGDLVFPSKDALKKACQEVLYAHELGQTVTEPLYDKFLRDLLLRHSKAEIKMGVGVASFQVKQGEPRGRCFWLTRTDGTRTYFSYPACIRGEDLTPERKAAHAFRHEIRDQLISFKQSTFSGPQVYCALTGAPVDFHNSHVDHVYPLKRLWQDFLLQEGLVLLQVQVQPWREGEHRILFADRAFAERWAEYHRQRAMLRITSAEANLSREK
jgi:uncharacterized protein DUF3223